MACTDYDRHEKLLQCPHRDVTMVAVKLADGCSGTVCAECEHDIGARRWPDVAERIAGPADGLDVLQMLRALGRSKAPGA